MTLPNTKMYFWEFLFTELNFFTSLKHGNKNCGNQRQRIKCISLAVPSNPVFLICKVKSTCVPHFSYAFVPFGRSSAECLNDLNTHNLTQVNDSGV